MLTTGHLPEVKVSGAMRNIMIDGDLSAHVNLDTLDKTHLYGLGPVEGLNGEIVVIDGTVYSTFKEGSELKNQENKASLAAMFVYSKVRKWKEISIHSAVKNYTELETLIKQTAQKNGYNTEKPFAFKIKTSPSKAAWHVIDWKPETKHTMENHNNSLIPEHLLTNQFNCLAFTLPIIKVSLLIIPPICTYMF